LKFPQEYSDLNALYESTELCDTQFADYCGCLLEISLMTIFSVGVTFLVEFTQGPLLALSQVDSVSDVPHAYESFILVSDIITHFFLTNDAQVFKYTYF
jgi:hypothetical protein